MKRLIALVMLGAVLLGLPVAARAEGSDRVMWGVKGNVNLVLPGNWKNDHVSNKMFSPGYGVALGGVCNVWMGRNFYVEPGVSFYYDQYSYYNLIISDDGLDGYIADPSLYKVGVRVPVVVGYEIGFNRSFGMNVFTGPQLDYAVGGRVNGDFKPDTMSNDLWGPMNNQRRCDVSWKVGVGFPAGNFQLSLEADFGLTNLLKPVTGTEKDRRLRFRENRLGVALTYYL